MIITVKIKNSYGRELIYPGRKGIEAIILQKLRVKLHYQESTSRILEI